MLLVAIIAAIALTLRRRKDSRSQDPAAQVRARREERVRAGLHAGGDRQIGAMMQTLSLSHYLVLARDPVRDQRGRHLPQPPNLIVLLMAIELMLLAVNMNFIAFSHFLGDLAGQVFVFFILTVAAAESAIGLAILVVLFRNLNTIDVEDLDSLKG